MNGKRAAILHPCAYTRVGLANLLSSSHRTVSTGEFNVFKQHLTALPDIELAILALEGDGFTATSTLALITEWLQEYRPYCKIMLVLDKANAEGLTLYVRQLSNVIGVLNPNVSLPQLHIQLYEALVAADSNADTMTRESRLTLREHQVLRSMLLGCNVDHIACSLEISIKTVSHYKCSALRKLGIRNLQALLLTPFHQMLLLP